MNNHDENPATLLYLLKYVITQPRPDLLWWKTVSGGCDNEAVSHSYGAPRGLAQQSTTVIKYIVYKHNNDCARY